MSIKPKINRDLNSAKVHFGSKFGNIILGGEWWQGQAQNMAIFYFSVKFDLEVQGQLPPKTIGILTKVLCSCGPNLVILAWTRDKLSRGQASGYHTDTQTDRRSQRQYPKAKTGLG